MPYRNPKRSIFDVERGERVSATVVLSRALAARLSPEEWLRCLQLDRLECCEVLVASDTPAESGMSLRSANAPAERTDLSPISPGSAVTYDDVMRAQFERAHFLAAPEGDPECDHEVAGVTILSWTEVLDRLRLLFVNNGLFLVSPGFRVNEGFYYLYRFKKVFSSYQKAWSTASFANSVVGSAGDNLQSLGQRLELICRAADQTSYFALRRADNDNQDHALYHAAFLIMLITGAFDDVAWLIARLYGIEVDKMGVGLRVIAKNRGNTRFWEAMADNNPALSNYLRSPNVQGQIRLFYPVRHKLQHGLFLEAVHYSNPSKNFDRNLFVIPDEMVTELRELFGDEAKLRWGLKPGHDGTYVDPHRLASEAVKITAEIINGALDRIPWMTLIDDVAPSVQETIVESWNSFEQGVGTFLGWGTEPIYF